MLRRSLFVGVALAAGVLLSFQKPWAFAGDPDHTELARKVEELQRALQELDARVEALEHSLPPPGGSDAKSERGAGGEGFGREERKAWREVHRGMTEREVTELLGPPVGTMAQGRQRVWYYVYPEAGSGTVVLSPDGKVTGWQKPPFGQWGR